MEKVNGAIEMDLANINTNNNNNTNIDYQKINLLYEKKHRLEGQLETLYSEWVNAK